jgi:hypothetical protein
MINPVLPGFFYAMQKVVIKRCEDKSTLAVQNKNIIRNYLQVQLSQS